MGDAQTIIELEVGWNKEIKVIALDPLEVWKLLIDSLFSLTKLALEHAWWRFQKSNQTFQQPRLCESLHVSLYRFFT